MKYLQRRFTVPLGSRSPEACKHGWVGKQGRCIFCGAEVEVKLVFVPRFKWCCNCRKRARISYNGKDYCAPCLNRSDLFSHRDRRTKPTLLAPPEAVDEVQSCDTSGSSSP